MNKTNPKGFNGWTIDKGDYKRDNESTNSHEKKIKRLKFFVRFVKAIGVLLVIFILILLITI